jgi:hypothetical protein
MYSQQDRYRAVDVQAIMREIRTAVRAQNRKRDDTARIARRSTPGHLPALIARLKASTVSLEEAAKRIGEIPPGPKTLRARVGALAVAVMQRSLFWLVPAVRSNQQNLVHVLRDHVAATEDILKALQQTNVQLEFLRRSVEESRSELPSPEAVTSKTDKTDDNHNR